MIVIFRSFFSVYCLWFLYPNVQKTEHHNCVFFSFSCIIDAQDRNPGAFLSILFAFTFFLLFKKRILVLSYRTPGRELKGFEIALDSIGRITISSKSLHP